MVNSSSKKRRHENSSSNEDEVEQEYQVEAILNKRVRGKKTQYLLKWKGYSNDDNTVRFSARLVKIFFLKFFDGILLTKQISTNVKCKGSSLLEL